MRDFYEKFYQAIRHSAAHSLFCERSFGRDLCQHGFADMAQIDALIAATGLAPGDHALDLGCGNGMIAEYISDCTGAHLSGIDYISEAIHQANERSAAKADRLSFAVGDINALALPTGAFDAIISIDSLYFSSNYTATIGQLVSALRPGGRLAILFSHGREPWVPLEEFPTETLAPDKTPLARALQANRLSFITQEFTAEDQQLAQLRKQVLMELQPQFEAEELLFIYENRMGDAKGISDAIERGLHRRYLYVCWLTGDG